MQVFIQANLTALRFFNKADKGNAFNAVCYESVVNFGMIGNPATPQPIQRVDNTRNLQAACC